MQDTSFNMFAYDNVIEIIPNEPIEDNCIYEITLRDIYSKDHSEKIDEKTITICTKLDPLYCTIEAVKSLIGTYNISDSIILYNIREASKFAEYVRVNSVKYDFQKDKVKVEIKKSMPFEVSEYVKYKTAYTCLLREYINRSNELGLKGTLGDISFENSDALKGMKDLLDELKALVDEWEMYLRGYGFEGRAKPQSAVKSINAVPPINQSNNGYSRGVLNEF